MEKEEYFVIYGQKRWREDIYNILAIKCVRFLICEVKFIIGLEILNKNSVLITILSYCR
jgi:hypothetical protein